MAIIEIIKLYLTNPLPNRRVTGAIAVCTAALILSSCDLLQKTKKTNATSGYIKNAQSHIDPISPGNAKNLFAKTLRSEGERITRLERAMQDLRNDFDSVRPSIRRLVTVEGEIQTLIKELEKINQEPVSPPPARPAQRTAGIPITTPQKAKAAPAKPAKPAPAKTPPPAVNGQAAIYDLRVGEHPGKTRLVLDANKKVNFSIDLDNSENIMIVELPGTSWNASTAKQFKKSSFISSYAVENAGGSTILIVQLRRNAKIGYKDDLPALKGSGRRIVIDLIGG